MSTMRTIALAAILLSSLAVTTQAQELKKGNLVGTHLMSVELKPGVTMAQFTEFFVSNVIPQHEKVMGGWKIYPVRRIRGEKADGLAVIMVVSSEAVRDKYYNADGTPTDLNKTLTAKLQPTMDQLEKLGTIKADVYTDWLVY
jgi:hypothetical protein